MEEMNCQAGQRPKADLVKRSQTAIYENRWARLVQRSYIVLLEVADDLIVELSLLTCDEVDELYT